MLIAAELEAEPTDRGCEMVENIYPTRLLEDAPGVGCDIVVEPI